MSKTVEELIGVYIEASNAVEWEAEKRGLCPMTLDMQRAGVVAIVRALRDEFDTCEILEDARYVYSEQIEQAFNTILNAADADKATESHLPHLSEREKALFIAALKGDAGPTTPSADEGDGQ